MRKLTWSLLILIIALWAVISVYWTGTEKKEIKPQEIINTSTTLSPATLLVSSDSAVIATMSSPSVRVTTSQPVLSN